MGLTAILANATTSQAAEVRLDCIRTTEDLAMEFSVESRSNLGQIIVKDGLRMLRSNVGARCAERDQDLRLMISPRANASAIQMILAARTNKDLIAVQFESSTCTITSVGYHSGLVERTVCRR